MGIKNGGNTILSFMQRGLFANRDIKKYAIYVDGELMRYKGMTEQNLCSHNAEEAIANTSFQYMQRLIRDIINMIGSRPQDVYVYMDGARVNNKCAQALNFNFDASQIRAIFRMQCEDYNYIVRALQYGESELQMYLQRNQDEHNLNIFITNDSDMISICYDHEPKITSSTISVENNQESRLLKFNELKLKNFNTMPTMEKAILDDNNGYEENIYNIIDSCLWINCASKNIRGYGMDFVAQTIGYDSIVFRTFVALCGTDFTQNLYTNSMISSILTASTVDKDQINKLTDYNDIAPMLFSFGVRGLGTVKRCNEMTNANHDIANADGSYDKIRFAQAIDIYIKYICTGIMSINSMPKFNMGIVAKHFVHALTNGECMTTGKTLAAYCENRSFDILLQNIRHNLGTWNIKMLEKTMKKNYVRRKTTAIKCRRRLFDDVDQYELIKNLLNPPKLYMSDSDDNCNDDDDVKPDLSKIKI